MRPIVTAFDFQPASITSFSTPKGRVERFRSSFWITRLRAANSTQEGGARRSDRCATPSIPHLPRRSVMTMWYRPKHLALALFAVAMAAGNAHAVDPYASAPPYAHPLAPGVTLTPLITTGQQVQLTGAPPGTLFRYVGIPDGLGAYLDQGAGQLVLLSNHEFVQVAGGAAGPLPSGSRVPALRLALPNVLSAGYWIGAVSAGEPSVLVAPGTHRIARLCSAFLANANVGFDRNVFMHGEEVAGAATFDGMGGSAFADFDGATWQLPRLGHANWENQVVAPFTGSITAVFGNEDGPSGGGALNSEVYLYVGTKVAGTPDGLRANGLDNGNLFVLAASDPLHKDEATFTAKGTSVPVHFEQVNPFQTDALLDAQSKALGSFNFVRVEDGACDPSNPGAYYFVTTGSPGTLNPFCRLYRLDFDPANPSGPATLTLLLDGSEGIVSPDNIDINPFGEMLICEDPNYNLGLPPINPPRDTYLWFYRLADAKLVPLAEIDRAAARAHALAADPLNTNVAAEDTPGGWEFSGVIDASSFAGYGAWILDVQAHSLRINPSTETVEGGQVLLLNVDVPTEARASLGLEAEATDSGVRLGWMLTGDPVIDGFRVLRSSSEVGPWSDVSGSLPSTQTSFVDTPVSGTWFYRVDGERGGAAVISGGAFRVDFQGGSGDALALDIRSPMAQAGPVVLNFAIPSGLAGTQADLSVYNVAGRRVAQLVNGPVSAGRQEVEWQGTGHAPGVYFASLRTQQGIVTKRFVTLH